MRACLPVCRILSVILAFFAYKTIIKGLNIKHAESEKAAITAVGGTVPQELKDRLIVSDAVQLANMPAKPIARSLEVGGRGGREGYRKACEFFACLSVCLFVALDRLPISASSARVSIASRKSARPFPARTRT